MRAIFVSQFLLEQPKVIIFLAALKTVFKVFVYVERYKRLESNLFIASFEWIWTLFD